MPFLAPIITAIAKFAAINFLTNMVVQLGISLLLSVAAQALMPKPKLMDRTVTVRAAVVPRDMVYGRARKGGVIVFLHSSGGKNQFLHLVIVLAAHRVQSIGAVWFDGEMALDASGTPTTAKAATGSITFSAQPTVNSTVTINKTAFTFVASGAVGNQVNIGANLAATMTALAVRLNASAVAGVLVATYTGTATALTIVHDTLGTAGNAFTLAASTSPASRGTVSGYRLTGGTRKGRWEGKVTVEKRLGADGQTAFSSLMANLPTEWTAAHRLAGCAALYLRLTYDVDAFPGGIPNITVDLEGKDDILDPRTGTNVYSENPALCLADYMAHPAFGLGAGIGAADGVDAASVIAAANICDERVDLAPGFTERRYACNGSLSLSESPKTLIEGLLSSMAGRSAMQGGTWRIHAGAWRVPEVTLTGDDVRAGGLVLATRVSQSENFNGVRGQFVSPENDWQPDDFPAVASAVYLAEDNGTRKWRDIVLPFTISAAMAQRLAKIELERARRQMTVKLAGKLAAWAAGVGETVMLSYDRWGFAAKPFEVHGLSLDLTASGDGALLLPELLLRETSPLVYDWTASEEAIYAAAPRTNLPGPDVPAPGTPNLAEALYETRAGTGVRTLILASWTAAPSDFVREYQIRARRVLDAGGTATGDDWITFGRTDQLFWEIRDVKPGRWEVAVKSVSVIGVSSPYAGASMEILGLTAPPAVLAGLTIQTAGGLAILKWLPSTDLDVRIGGRILIRHSDALSATWATSTSMDEVAGSDAVAIVPLKPGTYILRARDNSGNLGPVASVVTKGAQVLLFAPVTSLVADPGWPGALANVVVDGAALKLINIAAEGLFTFPAGMDFGALKRVRLRSVIDAAALNLAALIDARVQLMDGWLDVDDTEGAEIDVIVEARVTDDNPAAAPVWSVWSRLDSSEFNVRGVQLRTRLSSKSADYNVLVSKLRIHAEEVI